MVPPLVKPCINLNQATQAQLETLPGVGPVLAKRILAFRIRHGGFKSVVELLNVPGIGPKRFDQLKDYVCIESTAETQPPSERHQNW